MKNVIFAAIAALGIILGTGALTMQANAAVQQQNNYQPGTAGGNG